MTCPVCKSAGHRLVGRKDSYAIHLCDVCSVMFVHPMPSQEVLDDFYHGYHKTKQYSAKLHSKVRRAYKRIWVINRKGFGRRFLDVGCNVGFAVEAARKLGYNSLGIDVDCKAVEMAGGLFPSASFRCCSLETLAREQQKFDLVYCSEVIEHLRELDGFVKALRQVMNEGAVLYLTTPDVAHYTLPGDFEKLMKWNSLRPPEHLIYFSRRSMKHLLQKHGFGLVKFKFSFKSSMRVVASI